MEMSIKKRKCLMNDVKFGEPPVGNNEAIPSQALLGKV
jgi:hypothetical protein